MITGTRLTAEALAAQFTENTGRHILDSGDAYGRGWEKRAGMTAGDFLAQPQVTVDDFGGVTVSLFHVLANHLEHTADAAHLTAGFREWITNQPLNDAYYNSMSSVEEWLETIGAELGQSDNTYNFETLADGVVMFVNFTYQDVYYLALSTHNGADVRGGYSGFVVYETCDCWMYALTRATIACQMCNRTFFVDTYEITDECGTPTENGIGDRGACPECRWPELVGHDIEDCLR